MDAGGHANTVCAPLADPLAHSVPLMALSMPAPPHLPPLAVLLALLALLRVLDIVVGAPNLEGSSTRASLLRRALEPLRIIQANFALTDDPSASELSAIVERIKAARAAPGAGEGRGGVLAAGAPPGASREGSSSMGVAGTAGPDGQEAGDRARRTRESSQASQGSPALGVKVRDSKSHGRCTQSFMRRHDGHPRHPRAPQGAPPLSDGDSQLIEGWLEKARAQRPLVTESLGPLRWPRSRHAGLCLSRVRR